MLGGHAVFHGEFRYANINIYVYKYIYIYMDSIIEIDSIIYSYRQYHTWEVNISWLYYEYLMVYSFASTSIMWYHVSTDAEVYDGHAPVIGTANSLDIFQHPCSSVEAMGFGLTCWQPRVLAAAWKLCAVMFNAPIHVYIDICRHWTHARHACNRTCIYYILHGMYHAHIIFINMWLIKNLACLKEDMRWGTLRTCT